MKKIILSCFLFLVSCFSLASAYTLGLYSQSKTVQEILDIETHITPYKLPVVAFIYDNYILQGSLITKTAIEKLGTDRVYHITLSPDKYTAKQVADGNFDEEYMAFFQDVKKYNLKVLFRTMHEMNGGRYARSSDPDNFKKAWKRVFTLSRKAELGSENIQFIFSFNWHDMPINKEQERRKKNSAFGPASEGDVTPNQSSSLITCTPAKKKDTGCFTWEDYYPGDGWVDLIGFTAYNRGKATSNRRWVSFWDIINDPVWNNWQRIRTMGKPIYIDEVGTSAVKYNESFNWARSQEKYSRMTQPKNERLYDLAGVVSNTPEIIGMNYFNVDYTEGLQNLLVGESDWKILDPSKGMMYDGGRSLLEKSNSSDIKTLFTNPKVEISSSKQNQIIPTLIRKNKGVSTPKQLEPKVDLPLDKPSLTGALSSSEHKTASPKTIRKLNLPIKKKPISHIIRKNSTRSD